MPAKAVSALRLIRGAPSTPHIEPVSTGIPFAPGILQRPEQIGVIDGTGRRLASSATPLARWPDGSLRWVLVDWLVAASGSREEEIAIDVCDDTASPAPAIACTSHPGHYDVDTGVARLDVPRDVFTPFAALRRTDALAACVAAAELRCDGGDGRTLMPRLRTLAVESA